MSKIVWLVVAAILWIFFCAWWYCKLEGACSGKDTTAKEIPVKVMEEAPEPEALVEEEPVQVVTPDPEPAQEVVVAELEPFVCTEYLAGTLKLGLGSNTETDATKLEEFLNEYEGGSLEVDGAYGPTDEKAVRAFQQKYSADVLDPLDLDGPTGHVLGYTRAQINALYCQYKEAERK